MNECVLRDCCSDCWSRYYINAINSVRVSECFCGSGLLDCYYRMNCPSESNDSRP